MKQFTPNCLIPFNFPIKIWERIATRIQISDTGCWLWQGFINPGGYSVFTFTKNNIPYAPTIHRVVYTAYKGVITKGLCIDHLCRVRHCCNPAHLEAVTPQENNLRGDSFSGRQARQTHCIHGHEFTPENTWLQQSAKGGYHRRCRQCMNRRNRERYHRKKRGRG